MRLIIAGLFALAVMLSPAAYAVQPDEIMADPVKEARARDLSRELRCMVCQNQSIDDSEAPLARDLRLLVRERLKAGDSDTQVVDFMVARYGEFVLLRPRVSWHTAILWGAPLTILIAGLFGIGFSVLRRSSGSPLPEVAELSEGERLKLNAIERSQPDSAQVGGGLIP
jgi:cytochrome c-type biogenesis protein CcmH